MARGDLHASCVNRLITTSSEYFAGAIVVEPVAGVADTPLHTQPLRPAQSGRPKKIT
jgi:hypothetical protein